MTDTAATLATPDWKGTPGALDAIAVLGAVGAFWLLGGPLGAGLALVLGAALFALPGLFVMALGQVVLATILPENPQLWAILLGELPLVALLGADVDRRRAGRQAGTAFLFGAAVLVASVAAIALAPRLWIAALAVLGVTALFLYGGHRYAVVRYETRDRTGESLDTDPEANG